MDNLIDENDYDLEYIPKSFSYKYMLPSKEEMFEDKKAYQKSKFAKMCLKCYYLSSKLCSNRTK